MPDAFTCPVCAALVANTLDARSRHRRWHERLDATAQAATDTKRRADAWQEGWNEGLQGLGR